MSSINKAALTRKVIISNIGLVQNGQDDLVIKKVLDEVGYFDKSTAKRAFYRQKDAAIEQHRLAVAAEAAEPMRNKNGDERKTITKRKGKDTLASKVREILNNAIKNGMGLDVACDEIETLVVDRYKAKGKYDEHKPAYYRLIARNELERLTPTIQAALGVRVNTPQELKLVTRSRGWQRKSA